jgi:hypothetical protein
MKWLLLLIIMFSGLSCWESKSNVVEFEKALWGALLSTKEIEVEAGDLNWPPYIWKRVLKTEEHCLWYRTPHDEEPGILRLVRSTICDSESYELEYLVELRDITELRINRRMSLRFEFTYKRDHRLSFAVSTLNLQEHDRALEIHSGPPLPQTRISSGAFCRRVNEECEIVIEDQCQLCEQGWIQIIDYHCPLGGSRLCATDHCGARGEPACPRGTRHLIGEIPQTLCFENSDAGFCEIGLTTSCDERGILICL